MIQLDLNMKMPDKCSACKFFRVESQMYCTAVVGYTTVSKPHERKPAWCPLHEITDPDTVSRQAVISAINNLHDKPNSWLDHAVDAVNALPPSPSRPQGHWIRVPVANGLDRYQCDKCGHYVTSGEDKNFCPHCGDKKGGAV